MLAFVIGLDEHERPHRPPCVTGAQRTVEVSYVTVDVIQLEPRLVAERIGRVVGPAVRRGELHRPALADAGDQFRSGPELGLVVVTAGHPHNVGQVLEARAHVPAVRAQRGRTRRLDLTIKSLRPTAGSEIGRAQPDRDATLRRRGNDIGRVVEIRRVRLREIARL